MPPDSDSNAILAIGPDDHVLAVGDPKVTVIEYADFECPGCRLFAQRTFPVLRRDYIDTGKIRWVFRHAPVSIHPNAQAAAEASECAADQGKFWEYQHLLFNGTSGLSNPALKGYASELGLDSATFDACLDSHAKAEFVQSQQAGAAALGVPGTFTFFINGDMVVGYTFFGEFAQLLDAALAEAGG
jgi:protein-disulfide isomerase